MSFEYKTIDAMIGKTMADVYRDGEALHFHELMATITDGRLVAGDTFVFEHQQECCESVEIVDICGDLDDLIGAPILVAEECANESHADVDAAGDERVGTWTFYRFGTAKGTVTVRWLGQSNGYYSEGVSMVHTRAPRPFDVYRRQRVVS